MLTDEMLTEYALPAGLIALMLYMVFIVWQLGRESKAGRFGMFVLFLGLMVGVLGFSIKYVIKFFLQD